jgi:glycine cleavage system aminomethyltransferase T
VGVWDAVWTGGRDAGLETVGYRALDSLRMEKGYRYFGTDMTMLETPHEAGLGMFVRTSKPGFIGREATLRRLAGGPPSRRLRTVVIGEDEGYLPIYGGEAVRVGDEVVGRLRSVAYGTTVRRTVGYVYLPSQSEEGAPLVVDVFDSRVPATVVPDVLVDPGGDRMRG